MLHLAQVDATAAQELEQAARRGDNHGRLLVAQGGFVPPDGHATVQHGSLDFREVLRKARVLVANLKRQLTNVAQNQHAHVVAWVQLLQRGEDEDSSLAHA